MKSESPKDKINSFGEESSIHGGSGPHGVPQENSDQQKEERILSLTVDIPQGGQEILEIKDTDDITAIANQFCAKHNLDGECKQALLESIKEHLFGGEQAEIEAAPLEAGKESPIMENEELVVKKRSNKKEKGVVGKTLQEKKSLDPNKMKQLNEELELWKKEVEGKIKKGNVFNQPAINEHSKKIVEKKGLTKVPAHERLHQTARDKQNSQRKTKENNATTSKRPKTKDQKKSQDLNLIHFQLLYNRGLRQMKKMEKNMEQVLQEKAKKELESAPFKPKINPNSRKMVINIITYRL